MTLSALGIFSAAGAGGGATGTYELVSTQILGSAQASITFDVSSLSSTYKHLQIRVVERQSNAVVESRATLSLNGNAGASAHYMVSTGSSTLSVYESGSVPVYSTGASATSDNFSAKIIDILDPFSTTKNKTIKLFGGFTNSSFFRVVLQSGLWTSTSSTTSITFTSAANYVAGSRFSIYGIRG